MMVMKAFTIINYADSDSLRDQEMRNGPGLVFIGKRKKSMCFLFSHCVISFNILFFSFTV